MKRFRLKLAATGAVIALMGALVPGISAAQTSDEESFSFSGEGYILGSLRYEGPYLSVTDTEFLLSCPVIPLSQGVDGHVFDLGQVAPSGSVAVADGSNDLDLYDLDMSFYDAGCNWIDFSASAGTSETATVPDGTRYIVVSNWIGVDTTVTLNVTDGATPTPTPTVEPSPTTDPGESEYLRGDYSGALSDPLYDKQWNMDIIDATAAWQEEQATGYGITISVVDSGVDTTHPDLTCPYKMNILPGSDTGESDDNPEDVDGHGTHVNGIAGACTDNGEGVVGVAPDSILMPVKMFGYPTGPLFGYDPADIDAAMAKGIRFATENGAHVMNLSIGDIPPFSHLGPDGYPETEEALAEARDAGVVIAAAAGNWSQPTCEFPSLSRNVICVVATDANDERSDYSDLAVNVDRNADEPGLEPVVAAPGGGGFTSLACEDYVLSTYWRGASADDRFCSEGEGYEWLSGTSMSAPHVAGVAALLYDRLGGVRSKANADLIVQTILDTAEDLGAPGYDPLFGFGRLDALAAVQAVDPVPHAIYPLPPPF